MVMEASLLVSPKPSMPRTVSLALSARGPARRCLVVAAATTGGHSKELGVHSAGGNDDGGEVQQQLLAPAVGQAMVVGAGGGLFGPAAAAAAMATACGAALLPPPCHAASAAALEVEPLFRAVALLGDLDPATAKAVAGVAGPALSAFGFLFILRIVMSWYPRLPVTEFPYVVAYAPTEPFLAVTRKVIPPLGGVDVTPVVWFGLVSFLNEILVGPQGLLILLSQQV
ncbi:hypothetical protein U9M48_017519 [Paspalum notatum var. saurae]|uniref:Uncharacterized protein n=1 Tax=Paspalum notatum var. saurae TaxID=547442 RepID=A0AAQ3T8Y5_PASNO